MANSNQIPHGKSTGISPKIILAIVAVVLVAAFAGGGEEEPLDVVAPVELEGQLRKLLRSARRNA